MYLLRCMNLVWPPHSRAPMVTNITYADDTPCTDANMRLRMRHLRSHEDSAIKKAASAGTSGFGYGDNNRWDRSPYVRSDGSKFKPTPVGPV